MKIVIVAGVAAILAAGAAAAPDGPSVTTSTTSDGKQTVIILSQDGRTRQRLVTVQGDGHGPRIFTVDGEGGVYTLHDGGDRNVVVRSGANVRILHAADCDRDEVARPAPASGDRGITILCTRAATAAASPEQRVERLERMLDRIQHEDALSDQTKAQIGEALRGAIEQLRSQR